MDPRNVKSRIFLFVENGAAEESVKEAIPEGHYVTLRFQGSHDDASSYYLTVFKYIENYEVRSWCDFGQKQRGLSESSPKLG